MPGNVNANALLPTNARALLRCRYGRRRPDPPTSALQRRLLGGDGAAVDDVAHHGVVLRVQLLERRRGLRHVDHLHVVPQVDIESKVRKLVHHMLASSAEAKHGQPGVNTWSTWGQHGANLGSTRGQPGVNTGSAWGQHGLDLRSNFGQPLINIGSTCTAVP